MGRKSRRPARDGELKDIQRLKLENQKLRKQISKLRKEMSRIDIDRYSHLKDLIESQERQDENFDKNFELEQLKKKWECHQCARDYLRIIMIPRLDGLFYMRRCPTCGNKTKIKRHEEGIEGISSDETMEKD